MSTAIEWTDVTDNIIAVKSGGWWCRKISPGCANCYAARLNQNAFYGGNKLAYSGPAPDLILRQEIIDGWQRQRKPKKHFVASMTDVFGDWVPQAWVDSFLIGMMLAEKQIFQVLTKRPDVAYQKIRDFLNRKGIERLTENIWIGTSVENQECADLRIPQLLAIPAKVRFLSCEPLLGFTDIQQVGDDDLTIYWPLAGKAISDGMNDPFAIEHGGIHWVICGGESGPKARPMHPGWARSLRDQCQAASVPFFFKQWGEWAPMGPIHAPSNAEMRHVMADGSNYYPGNPAALQSMFRIGKKSAGRILDAREWNEFPKGGGL